MALTPVDQSGADGGYRPLAEINVTPFVDVMLVLLIVFMVAAPLMTVGVNVALPKTSAARTIQPPQPLAVSIDAEGRVYIGKTETAADQLVARLAEIRRAEPERIVLVRGDQTLDYGRVMEVMGEVSKAGFAKVSLIAEGQPVDPEE